MAVQNTPTLTVPGSISDMHGLRCRQGIFRDKEKEISAPYRSCNTEYNGIPIGNRAA